MEDKLFQLYLYFPENQEALAREMIEKMTACAHTFMAEKFPDEELGLVEYTDEEPDEVGLVHLQIAPPYKDEDDES